MIYLVALTVTCGRMLWHRSDAMSLLPPTGTRELSTRKFTRIRISLTHEFTRTHMCLVHEYQQV